MVEGKDLIFREVQRFGLWIRLLVILFMALAVGIKSIMEGT